ncbi:amino acid transporter [Staphylococcus succinus]|jgi:L-lysine exporter family protein LysE/ArgO|uniref:Lysine transporter LysE n=2 Tax=Staphylococcus succinus TaxID=61015 RepID=A0A9Q6HNQ0_9STAP|nr:LysE family transporter [Staphylococcus succinus]MBU0436884.1 LysE family transporter [Staphylococcus succinus]MEB7462149.1 LysE family transporter [Staphylococcus succinus]MEB8125885.1 LysE family transporter [Staphylococcus succinus]MEB8210861.1 LysE family transporter [Staphylococcus succinus]PKI22530.1 lysine transporter LysE [Staphylococcus succinus]
MLQPLIHGFLLALGLILPLGAQNVFVFNQGANYKSIFKVLPVIITAGVCDSLLIILAVLGVSVILLSFPILQVTIYCIGLVFLLYMAWSMWMAKPERVNTTRPMSTKKQITFALSVSLLNPHAIMDTIGVIGTNGAIYEGVSKGIFMIATLSVSWLWFFLLAILGKALGHMDTSGKYIMMINKISVVIILVVFGIIFKQLMMIVC